MNTSVFSALALIPAESLHCPDFEIKVLQKFVKFLTMKSSFDYNILWQAGFAHKCKIE